MKADNFGRYVSPRFGEIGRLNRGKARNITREWLVGVRQLERWRETREDREAARKAAAKKDLLAWAYSTAKARLAAQGEDATRWVEEVKREAEECEARLAAQREYQHARRAARMAKEAAV